MKHCVMGLVSLLLVGSLTGCGAVQVRDRAYVQSITLSAKESASEVALHLLQNRKHRHKHMATPFLLRWSRHRYSLENPCSWGIWNCSLWKTLPFGKVVSIAGNASAFSFLQGVVASGRRRRACRCRYGIAFADATARRSCRQSAGNRFACHLNGACRGTENCPAAHAYCAGFGLAVCRPAEDPSLLSADSVAGLCWMRGKNLPKRLSVATEQGTVDCVLSSSAAKFTAVVAEDGTAAVTLQIQLTAEDAMSEETEAQLRKQIQRQCQSAWEETVFQLHADVFSLGALLNSQCHSYAVQTDWATICETATFSCQISIRS